MVVVDSDKKLSVFIVVGRLGKSLTVSKTVPFTTHSRVNNVLIFSEEKGFDIEGATYVTLSKILNRSRWNKVRKLVRKCIEPIQLSYYAVKLKPDIINGVFTLPKGLNAVIAGKISRTKSVVSVIGGTVEITTRLPLQWFWKRLNLWMLRSCDAVTTKGSKVTAWLVEQGIPAEKIFNLNGSIDTDKFCIDESLERDIDILFVGTFRKLKGPDRVLKVVDNLVKEGNNIQAAFLGNGVLFDEIKEKIKKHSLEDYISLEGYQEQTAPYFKRSKLIVMPSMSEGLPTAMLEAMASGCVPVVSDVGNVTDAAKHKENAMVLNHWNNIEAFTAAAKRLLEDKPFRERLSLNGRKTVVEKYTPEKQAEVVDEILHYLNK